MTSIQSQSLSAGPSPRQNALSDSQFSSYVRKQSFSAYESLDAGLTIQTKEGDLVTLTSNTFSEFDALMYNSKGVLQTEAGKVTVTQNQRQITLTSGESFSFSVVGDLSEEELADIEAIVKGIDEIISQMAQGDMDDAVSKALSMGGYDTVSMYAADITYQKSYAMRSEIQGQTGEIADTNQAQGGDVVEASQIVPEEETAIPSVKEPFPENHRPRKRKHNSIHNINQFIEKMAERLEKYEEKLVEKAQKPIDKLFRHHLKDAKNNNKDQTSSYNAIETAQKQVSRLIDKMAGEIFKENFSAFFQ
ncbi:MAG: hypothetical protein KKE44_18575 [Proteobacteria bacterium]|nr:hypothetical protein [Pseudomonadota bacterium]MBU1584739.1 hypothetical protein [Pseudomonadota bacterium]MBU2454427.1 hypothetical protein [Pseudomonadota bacterium]MBU2628806.1 hypothetical protein [Pseudomonadota bacterium]